MQATVQKSLDANNQNKYFAVCDRTEYTFNSLFLRQGNGAAEENSHISQKSDPGADSDMLRP